MTSVIEGEIVGESTPPTPPTTPLARRAWIGGMYLAERAWTVGENVAWRCAELAVSWPKVVVPAVAVLPVLPVVEWTHVTGAVLAGSVLLTSRPGIRARIPILPDKANARGAIARIRAEWPRVCADTGLAKTGKDKTVRTPAIRAAVRTPVGVRLSVDGTRLSLSTRSFMSKSQDIRTGLGARDIQITNKDRYTDIHLVMSNPFARPVLSRDLPAPDRTGVVVTGLDSYGQPVIERPDKHRLYAGEPESGKSSAIWRLIEGMQVAGIHFRLRVFDPKDGVEFAALEDAAYAYSCDPFGLTEFLENAIRAYQARAAAMREAGIRRLEGAQLGSEDWPLDIIVIDELITALKMNKKAKVRWGGRQAMELDEALMQYMSVAPGAGHFVWAATQLAQKEVIGTLADLFTSKTCLRVPSAELVRVVLGDASAYPAHEIPRDRAHNGVGYTFMDGVGIVKYRAGWVDTDARRQITRTMELATIAQRKRTTWDKN